MQQRSLFLLIAAAVVCASLAIAALARGDRYASSAPANRKAFPSLAAEIGEVASVGLERKGLKVTFTRRGEDWLVVPKADYPAAAAKVRGIVLALAGMRLIEPKTRLPNLYKRLEVQEPGTGNATLVSIAGRSGRNLARLIVGRQRFDRLGEGHPGVYVREPGHARSWLASGDLDVSGDLKDWLDRRILDIPDSRIAKLVLTAPDGARLVLNRAKPGDAFAVEGAPPKTRFKEAAIGEPATALAALDLDDVAPAAKMPVPQSGVAAASYTTFDGLTIDLRLVGKDKTGWIAVDATGTGKAAPEAKKIEARVSGWSYAIPEYKAGLVKTGLADLTEPQKGS